jgi:hypothetical protein
MKGVAADNHDMLLRNGLTEEDITFLDGASELLKSADADQEEAKKLQESATKVRNAAEKKLKDLMFKSRSFAQNCFIKNPEILLQFKPISHGKRSANGTEAAKVKQETVK